MFLKSTSDSKLIFPHNSIWYEFLKLKKSQFQQYYCLLVFSMSGGASRSASFFDEFTNLFWRANSSSEDIFGEDTLYGMCGVAHGKVQRSNEKNEAKRKSCCVQEFWEIRETQQCLNWSEQIKFGCRSSSSSKLNRGEEKGFERCIGCGNSLQHKKPRILSRRLTL